MLSVSQILSPFSGKFGTKFWKKIALSLCSENEFSTVLILFSCRLQGLSKDSERKDETIPNAFWVYKIDKNEW